MDLLEIFGLSTLLAPGGLLVSLGDSCVGILVACATPVPPRLVWSKNSDLALSTTISYFWLWLSD